MQPAESSRSFARRDLRAGDHRRGGLAAESEGQTLVHQFAAGEFPRRVRFIEIHHAETSAGFQSAQIEAADS